MALKEVRIVGVYQRLESLESIVRILRHYVETRSHSVVVAWDTSCIARQDESKRGINNSTRLSLVF